MAHHGNESANIQQGKSVNIVGTIDQPATVSQAAREWHLDRSSADRLQADRLQKEGAYVTATQVTPIQR